MVVRRGRRLKRKETDFYVFVKGEVGTFGPPLMERRWPSSVGTAAEFAEYLLVK